MEKPKVRFSHNSDTAAEVSTPKEFHVQKEKKVKVKSNVPVNLPIKVLKNGKRLILRDQENKRGFQVNTEHHVSKNASNDQVNERTNHDDCKEIDMKQLLRSKSETSISETPINVIDLTNDELDQSDESYQKCADRLQEKVITETDKMFSKAPSMQKKQMHRKLCNANYIIPIEKSIPYIHCEDSDGNDDVQEIKVVKNINACKVQHGNKTKDSHGILKLTEQENKENVNGHNDFCRSFYESKVTTNADILKDATPPLFNKNRNTKTKKPAKIQKKLELMPCAKFKSNQSACSNYLDEQVNSSSKTRSLFNIAGKGNNISVEPEMLNILHNEHLKCNFGKPYQNTGITSENLLSRPEYNSTVCVMKKLKEFEEEKLIKIKDVESLPTTYKNLVHGKVSTALNFTPYESIYKNLVNLSVDMDKLPARLTRTKDPEPRNKDVTPRLSQFFKPKRTQEHFIPLDPKIFDPVKVNTLSAFVISNMMCTWRTSRDSF